MRDLSLCLGRAADGSVHIDFPCEADLDRLVIPVRSASGFSDGLWKHTCVELFAAAADGSYREFNFSPSSRFAIYDFVQYRSGMSPFMPDEPPQIESAVPGMLARVRLPPALFSVAGKPVHSIGASAVLEEQGGRLSYWAIAHGGDRPDFHRAEGFVLRWPPAAGT